MACDENLITKIKNGIKKSRFPLEMKIAKILSNNDWRYSMNRMYFDFETGKYQEADFVARKQVGGIDTQIFIECKRAEEKQMLLYCPINDVEKVKKFFSLIYAKCFPQLDIFEKDELKRAISNLHLFDTNRPWAKNILFSKDANIVHDNIDFNSSLYGMIKHSIQISTDGYAQEPFPKIYFYVVIWDGLMFNIIDSEKDEFDLIEVDYGQFKMDYKFKLQSDNFMDRSRYNDYKYVVEKMGDSFIIEIVKSELFEKHLKTIESFFLANQDSFKNWGKIDEEEKNLLIRPPFYQY